MNINKRRAAAASVLAAAVIATVGCTRHVSKDISAEGSATEIVFPSPDDKLVLKEGTFPNLYNLGQIGPGVTKDQLYYLIGRPHFQEGFSAREWDYLFHFRIGAEIRTCQYKVIFDRDYHGQSFHWLPAECAQLVRPVGPPPKAPEPVAPVQRFDLSGDALFAFGRSGINDIEDDGRKQLDDVATQLRASRSATVKVIGHTDRVGDDASNQALSQRRAETVRAFLASRGVPAETISAAGMGERQPVKECAATMPKAELVACLKPNRRVEIVATGTR